jgi:hypothetical protein
VVVTGRDGEPFPRLGPTGAEVNRRSRTWATTRRPEGKDLTAAASVVDPGAPPEWEAVAETPAYSWLEFRGLYERDRPPRGVLDAGETAVLRAWTVPLEQADSASSCAARPCGSRSAAGVGDPTRRLLGISLG